MFSEKEQENIINEFLNNIYVNDMYKIKKTKIINCPCKLEDKKAELCKLNLPQNIINDICNFSYQEHEDCQRLRRLPEIVERKNKCKAIDALTCLFVKCHFFPEKNVLKNEFNFSIRRIDCLKQIYRKIGNNGVDMVIEIIKLEKFNLDRTIADFNKVIKYMCDDKSFRKHCCVNQFVECPVFRISPFEED